MGKKALNFELSTNLKLCTIPRVMYCGAIARVIGLRVCAIVHNGLYMSPYLYGLYTLLGFSTDI